MYLIYVAIEISDYKDKMIMPLLFLDEFSSNVYLFFGSNDIGNL